MKKIIGIIFIAFCGIGLANLWQYLTSESPKPPEVEFPGPWRDIDLPIGRTLMHNSSKVGAVCGYPYMRRSTSSPNKFLVYCFGYTGTKTVPEPEKDDWRAFIVRTDSEQVEGPLSVQQFPSIPLPTLPP